MWFGTLDWTLVKGFCRIMAFAVINFVPYAVKDCLHPVANFASRYVHANMYAQVVLFFFWDP